jgi:3-hydroxybutyryl-CoA dehydrogenase
MTPPRLAVIGAGTMGHGIAYVAALAGCPVTLTDSRPEMLAPATERIDRLLAGGVERGKLTALAAEAARARLQATPSLADAVNNVDVTIEAIFENLAAKRHLFEALDRLTPPHVLLATNTSSLSVNQIAEAVKDPSRVVGMHFFNPVHLMRLVEIVRHDRCSADSVDRGVALAREMGKEPIVVKDSPGFASSRLGLALGLEAMRMLEEGVATAEDIDKAMELGYNHPMGPLKLTDLVGLDVRLAIAEYLHRTLEDSQFEPPRILRDKVAKGELGKKTGKGFYTWSP